MPKLPTFATAAQRSPPAPTQPPAKGSAYGPAASTALNDPADPQPAEGRTNGLAGSTHPKRPPAHEPHLADENQTLLAKTQTAMLPLRWGHRLRRTPLLHHRNGQANHEPESTDRWSHSQPIHSATPRLDRSPNQCALQHPAGVSGVQQPKRGTARATSPLGARHPTDTTGLPVP